MPINIREISFEFKRAGGPGGQNVNKVSTAVTIRFHIDSSQNLSDDAKARLKRLAGKNVNSLGELLISSQKHRTQEKNRLEVIRKLRELIHKAENPPKSRKFVERPLYDKAKRLDSKKNRSEIKKNRAKPIW